MKPEIFEEDEISSEDAEGAHDELPDSDEEHVGDVIEGENELANFVAAEIEETEFVEYDRLLSITESILFASDRPVTIDAVKIIFKGTNIKTKDIRRAISDLAVKYANAASGVTLEEISSGFQLRTKIDNVEYMKRHVKGRSFKLSGPALEVLAICAYKQPMIKAQVDEIRGVESGHLMRALMDRGLIRFAGKSDHPGKPMFYETTRKFLEIFGLRNLQELPSLTEIEELIPDGIGDVEEEKKTLGDLTGELSLASSNTYSDGEQELLKITDQLTAIQTSSDFFEQEKARMKRKRDEERAQDIRESMIVGTEVPANDLKWLKKFETQLVEEAKAAAQPEPSQVIEQTEFQQDAQSEAEAVAPDTIDINTEFNVEFEMNHGEDFESVESDGNKKE